MSKPQKHTIPATIVLNMQKNTATMPHQISSSLATSMKTFAAKLTLEMNHSHLETNFLVELLELSYLSIKTSHRIINRNLYYPRMIHYLRKTMQHGSMLLLLHYNSHQNPPNIQVALTVHPILCSVSLLASHLAQELFLECI